VAQLGVARSPAAADEGDEGDAASPNIGRAHAHRRSSAGLRLSPRAAACIRLILSTTRSRRALRARSSRDSRSIRWTKLPVVPAGVGVVVVL
jgi:hypothetical protein